MMDIYTLRLRLTYCEEFRREIENRLKIAAGQAAAEIGKFYGDDAEKEILLNLNYYFEYIARAYLDGLN